MTEAGKYLTCRIPLREHNNIILTSAAAVCFLCLVTSQVTLHNHVLVLHFELVKKIND